jgi:hypothetical protein
MTFPWNNKSQNREEGTLTATGNGEAIVLLHFRPDNVDFEIDGQTFDPTPLSSDPQPTDQVKCSVQHVNSKSLYRLVFKWNVFGTKYIKWVVTG